jgi:putative FmdB family regulatory protein
MPIYEYQCLACGKKTELLQRMNDAPLAACPSCGGEVKKLISSPAVQFKGSGWYVTDYASKKGGGGSGSSESKSEGKSEAESKSESKAEPKSDAPKAAASESKGSGGGSGGGSE